MIIPIIINWREDYSTYHYFKYEPIKWRVLEVGNGRALLLADQVLDTQKYNKSFKIITWENSSIRSWLNGREAIVNQDGIDYTNINFINAAFNTEEQKSITTTKVINDNNRQYETDGGSYTLDKIFLLSESEAYSEKLRSTVLQNILILMMKPEEPNVVLMHMQWDVLSQQ